MSNKIKLYDKTGKFIIAVPQPRKKFEGLQHYNKLGLFVREQFNKTRTEVVRSYADQVLVNPSDVFASMNNYKQLPRFETAEDFANYFLENTRGQENASAD